MPDLVSTAVSELGAARRAQGDRLVVLDLETTGLDERRHDVCQFAAIAVDGEWNEVGAIELKIFFDFERAEPSALEINGYDEATWKREAVAPAIARGRIADFLRRHATLTKTSKAGRPYTVARVCGHNAASFDGLFLAAWFKRSETFLPAACFEALDTLALARWASFVCPPGPRDHKLASVCEWLGVEMEKAHEALSDVRATVEVARRLAAAMRPAQIASVR
jgi:DNA polymerase III subunit epsilon